MNLKNLSNGNLWELVGLAAVELMERQDPYLKRPELHLKRNGRFAAEALIGISILKGHEGQTLLSVEDANFSQITHSAVAFPFDQRRAVRLNTRAVPV
jgi:hypothetical protein